MKISRPLRIFLLAALTVLTAEFTLIENGLIYDGVDLKIVTGMSVVWLMLLFLAVLGLNRMAGKDQSRNGMQ